ncbi:hypothetical protein NL676_000015 [Syzygium grande]|nr:hypothetical protein NL676_000015 [Syzygium grande]
MRHVVMTATVNRNELSQSTYNQTGSPRAFCSDVLRQRRSGTTIIDVIGTVYEARSELKHSRSVSWFNVKKIQRLKPIQMLQFNFVILTKNSDSVNNVRAVRAIKLLVLKGSSTKTFIDCCSQAGTAAGC